MQTVSKISNELNITRTLSELIKTYEEVYMIKMNKTRHAMLSTRDYYVRILALYQSIKSNYKRSLLDKVKGKEKEDIFSNVIKKTKDSAAVLITGNERFAGDINNEVFDSFLDYVKQTKAEIVVVGGLGRSLMTQRAKRLNFKYFKVEESFGAGTVKFLKPIVSYLLDFRDVRVFHGEFENMMRQEPVNRSVMGEIGEFGKDVAINDTREYYLFEPQIQEMLVFFETQIFTSLFKRSFDESVLAQIGARVKTLEQSTTQIDKHLKLLNYLSLKERKRVKNSKQQANAVSINFWGNK